MEPAQSSLPTQSSEPSQGPLPELHVSPTPLKSGRSGKRQLILICIMAFLLLLVIVFVFLKGQMKRTASQTNTQHTGAGPTTYPTKGAGSGSALGYVYGAWFTNESRIYTVDPITQKSIVLASLPFTIKQVHPVAANELVFINKTDVNDQGSELALFNTVTKQTKTLITPDAGYRMDDYRISPNGHYVVDWELQLSPKSTVSGGKARIYTIDLSHPTKQLIYDEVANGSTIHYPVLITDTKEVYFDTYLPNSGSGWGYGMSFSTFDGSRKADLSDMRNGTYATEPYATSDGRYLVFTGYDGSKGDGAAVQNGKRVALTNPNTVEAYDTLMKKRVHFTGLPANKLFYNVTPSSSDPSMVYFQVANSDTTFDTAVYTYSITSQSLSRVAIPGVSNPIIVASLSPSTMLIGSLTKDTSIAGNLGPAYHIPYAALSLFDMTGSKVTPVALGEVALAQYIGTMPVVANVLAAQATPTGGLIAPTPTPTPLGTQIIKTVPFATLTPVPTATPVPTSAPPAAPPVTKPNLEQTRDQQQSCNVTDTCRDRPGDNGGELHQMHN